MRSCLLASGAVLSGFRLLGDLSAQGPADGAIASNSFQGGHALGLVPFLGESQAPLDTLFGAELDGRLFTDLSSLQPQSTITPTEKSYVRTRASQLLATDSPWLVRLSGLAEKPVQLSLNDLKGLVKPQGAHLMECVGNGRASHFGMISAAEWGGMPLLDLLNKTVLKRDASRVMISGFDHYSSSSKTFVEGADRIFTLDELDAAKAFLATEMNGQPLSRDHGAPLRLVVPGWHGCTCIKWVTDIKVIGNNAEATSQMREFARRTHPTGVPMLARLPSGYHRSSCDAHPRGKMACQGQD